MNQNSAEAAKRQAQLHKILVRDSATILEAAGCAHAEFTPESLHGADPKRISQIMREAAFEAIILHVHQAYLVAKGDI